MYHKRGISTMHRNLIECPKGKKQLGRPRSNRKIILKWIPKKMSGMMCSALIRNITGTGGGFL
jgi:hypothetical protein